MSEQRNAERDREIIAAATEGPWTWKTEMSTFRAMGGFVSPIGTVCDFGDSKQYYPTEGTEPHSTDIEFIAASRDAFPHWLERAVAAEQRVAELERLVAELDEKLTDAENEIAWRRG